MSLFAYRTELRVDANKRRIQVSERAWWTKRTRRWSFDEVDHVAFRFESLPTAFRRAFQERRLTIETADQVERFIVELVLRRGTRVSLFAFFGEGSAMSGVIGALLDDTWLDVEGTHEDEGRAFVLQLTQITGLGLVPRSYEQVMSSLAAPCSACGQRNTSRERCLYCGADLVALGQAR